MKHLTPTTQQLAQRKRFYGLQRWKRLRKRVLAGSPLCAICGRAPATEADHVLHLNDNSTFWNTSNLRPACTPCNKAGGARALHAMGRGQVQTTTGGFATARWGKFSDRAGLKPDNAADIFQRFKGEPNAEPKD